jgi:hypothetical protein
VRNLILAVTPGWLLKFYRKARAKPQRFKDVNLEVIRHFSFNFKVIDFKFIDTNYQYDLKWDWWSRVYEYELVLNKLRELDCLPKSLVHNTCWGFQGCHVLFKTELEAIYSQVVNSDLLPSNIANTFTHDLREPCPDEWLDKFDFVINVSTIEEIKYPHTKIIENLLGMVKAGGFLIATFDLPGLQLEMIEKLFGRKIQLVSNPVTGSTSPHRMDQFDYLKVGYFVIQKL